jgi:hypothetical protein
MPAPDSNPKTRVGGMNKVPLHLIPVRALAKIAMAFADGGFKYQPYNWEEEKISASVYFGAAMRHIFAWWCGKDKTSDGVHPLAAACACLMMILDVDGTELFNDNRPPYMGDFDELLDEQAAILPALRARENTKFDLHDIVKGESK